jgi:hypothetical protein
MTSKILKSSARPAPLRTVSINDETITGVQIM